MIPAGTGPATAETESRLQKVLFRTRSAPSCRQQLREPATVATARQPFVGVASWPSRQRPCDQIRRMYPTPASGLRLRKQPGTTAIGARGGTRTPNRVSGLDPKSSAFASFATLAPKASRVLRSPRPSHSLLTFTNRSRVLPAIPPPTLRQTPEPRARALTAKIQNSYL